MIEISKNLTLTFDFSSAHFYEQTQWDSEKNKSHFGLCYSKYGHGHNYKWIIEIHDNNENLNLIYNHLVGIVKTLDHKHLNHEILFFKDKIPTTENISLYLKEQLLNLKIPQINWTNFKLFETESIWVEITNDKFE